MKTIRALRLALCGLLCLSAGCGKSSRFDEAAVVDVCGLVRLAEAEDVLGPLNEPPKPEPGSGFAGVCHWLFTSAGGDRNARLTVALVTHASNARGGFPTLGRWFEMNMAELKASDDPHPKELKGVGDRAWVFAPDNPSGSTLLMRQAQTFALMRISGAGSRQLEDFAKILSREFDARRPTTDAAANAPAARDVRATAAKHTAEAPRSTESTHTADPPRNADALDVAGGRNARAADAATAEKERTIVFYTVGLVEQCVRTDQLLRKSCDRWGAQLSEANRQLCALPSATFESRTADAYRAFRERYRDRIQASEPQLSTTLERIRTDFERQFATEIAGNLSALDLGTLNRELAGECATVENEWLRESR